MTLNELQLIAKVLIYGKEPDKSRALLIVEREIKLKIMNPVKNTLFTRLDDGTIVEVE